MERELERLASRFLHRRALDISARRSIVSFTFDDVPQSACQVGADLIESVGGTATFYVCGSLADGDSGFFHSRDLKALTNRGHEIGSHGFRHLDLQRCSLSEFYREIWQNDAYFESIGLPLPQSFAYPYGGVTPGVKHALSSRFTTMRGVQNEPNCGPIDRSLLKSVHLYSSTLDIGHVRRLLKAAAERPTWLIFLAHGVTNECGQFDINIKDLERVLAVVRASGLAIMPVSSALEKFQRKPSYLAALGGPTVPAWARHANLPTLGGKRPSEMHAKAESRT